MNAGSEARPLYFVTVLSHRILLPIVADRILYLILPHYGANATISRDNISTFGFLYGTFPTAPTVFVFASQYNLAMEIVSLTDNS